MKCHSGPKDSPRELVRKCDKAPSQYKRNATAGTDVVQSGRSIFDDFFQLRRLVGTTAPGHHDCSIQE
ncbi:hypothetical protein TNCV_1681961 [Trichonephila clavipes]|nr:hypothetical protein TNCV_1681961 [Trichonephila clavipes]